MSITFHPAASIFPLLEGQQFEELVADIGRNGLLEAIVLHPDGRVLDGRNRFRACLEAGVEPHFRTWDGQGSLVGYVVSLNLHRRHLSESQRAMIAVRPEVRELYQEEARARRDAGLRQNADAANLPERAGQAGEWREHAARDFSVSPRTVQHAANVADQGAPELADAVQRGEVSVSAAATVAGAVPPEEQAELVARGEKEILARAKEIRAKNKAQRQEDDYYPTPPWLTMALLRYLQRRFGEADLLPSSGGILLDACAGKGGIGLQVEAWASERLLVPPLVTAVELNPEFCAELPERWGVTQGDFLEWAAAAREEGLLFDFAPLNPPFTDWMACADAVLPLVRPGRWVCVLGFVNILGGQERFDRWLERRPHLVLVSPRRPQCREDTRSTYPLDALWICWRAGQVAERTELDWLDVREPDPTAGVAP